MYEGYGPGGVALLIEALTDNKNRTTAELRNIMSKKGGNMAGGGSVSYMFTMKGYISIETSQAQEDDLMDVALEAGAQDIKTLEKNFEIITAPQDLEKVKSALTAKNIKWEQAETTMLPSSLVKVAGNEAKQLLGLIEALENHDDVQQVYANFDIPDEIIEEVANSEE
jgi:YebC/PmpR family DNA-binding regulatory protein